MQEIDQEATFSEVMGEVSLADFGATLKNAIKTFGCFGLFVGFGLFTSTVFPGANESISQYAPKWVWWLLAAWFVTAIFASHKSYHRFEFYFPKLNPVGSLIVAAYCIAGASLLIEASNESDLTASALIMLIYFAWTVSIGQFFTVISLGHRRLIEKRAARAAPLDWDGSTQHHDD